MTNISIDDIAWLTHWYRAQCNGEWEHAYGVKIDTLDNPGWTLSIDLRDTALEGQPFEPVSFNLEGNDEGFEARWHHCRIKDAKFDCAGGAFDLLTLVRIFREWVEGQNKG